MTEYRYRIIAMHRTNSEWIECGHAVATAFFLDYFDGEFWTPIDSYPTHKEAMDNFNAASARAANRKGLTMSKKPSWQTNIVPRFIGPCLPVRGEFPQHAWPAPLELWSLESAKLAERHALALDFQRQCTRELARRAA